MRGRESQTPETRRFELLGLARERGRLEVNAASALLGVSPETIRRDLNALETSGRIRRSYGVAYPVEGGAYESELSYREGNYPEEKARIAAAAAALLGEAQTVFLDEGFTTQLIARRLPEDRKLIVVTASLPVATYLAPRPNLQVIVLGGRVRGNTLGAVDHWAADMLRTLVIDVAFIGANGVSADGAMTTPDPSVGVVKTAAIASSRRRIFAGAHHKFGASSFVRFGTLTDFEAIVTGRELSQSVANRFSLLGPLIHRV